MCTDNIQSVHISVITHAWMREYFTCNRDLRVEVLLVLVLSEYEVSCMHEAGRSSEYRPTRGLNDWTAQKCPSTNINHNPSFDLVLFRQSTAHICSFFFFFLFPVHSQTHFSHYLRFPGSCYTFRKGPFHTSVLVHLFSCDFSVSFSLLQGTAANAFVCKLCFWGVWSFSNIVRSAL